jgi:hypothetical protein
MLDNSTLPLDDSFMSSPQRGPRDQIKPYVRISPQKAHNEISKFELQKIDVIYDIDESQEDSSYNE